MPKRPARPARRRSSCSTKRRLSLSLLLLLLSGDALRRHTLLRFRLGLRDHFLHSIWLQRHILPTALLLFPS